MTLKRQIFGFKNKPRENEKIAFIGGLASWVEFHMVTWNIIRH